MKKKIFICLTLVFALILSSCGLYNSAKQNYYNSLEENPNSGVVEFNDITLTIPDGYIRDSTQTNETTKTWESDNYSKIVRIVAYARTELDENQLAQIMQNQKGVATGNVDIKFTEFLDNTAIESVYPTENGQVRDIVFNTNNFTYELFVLGDDYDVVKNSITTKAGITEENPSSNSSEAAAESVSEGSIAYDVPAGYTLFDKTSTQVSYFDDNNNSIFINKSDAYDGDTLQYYRENYGGYDTTIGAVNGVTYISGGVWYFEFVRNGCHYSVTADIQTDGEALVRSVR